MLPDSLISTIYYLGYGNLAPTTTLSRILMIFYGLLGIPMNGILLTQLGEFFSLVFVRAHRKYKSYKQSQSDYSPKKPTLETRKVGLAAQIFMYLTPGFVMFIFFPAFLFSYYEGWTYDQAVYYAFVTLTTIGFGDIVAGKCSILSISRSAHVSFKRDVAALTITLFFLSLLITEILFCNYRETSRADQRSRGILLEARFHPLLCSINNVMSFVSSVHSYLWPNYKRSAYGQMCRAGATIAAM